MTYSADYDELLATDTFNTLASVVELFADSSFGRQWANDPSDADDDCVPVSRAFTAACQTAGLSATTLRLHSNPDADHELHAITTVAIPTSTSNWQFAVDWTARQFDNVIGGRHWRLISSPLMWVAVPDAASTYPLPFVNFVSQSELGLGEKLFLLDPLDPQL